MAMASADLNGPNLPQRHGIPIVEALDRKRKSLESEILHFQALKEEEFKDYERELQLAHKQNEVQSTLKTLHPDKTTAPGLGIPGGGVGLIQNAINGNKAGGTVDTFAKNHHDQSNANNVGLPGGKGAERIGVENHEPGLRNPISSFDPKLDCRGLATPNYLPLLDTSPRYPRQRGDSSLLASSTQDPDLASHARATNTQLSSSATLPTTTFSSLHSPHQNSSFSASILRPTVLQGRRPSSRSDMSITSLRSSLRRPKSPKSPKHVLFSIDNLVLSPSTSPVLQKKGGVPPIPFSGLVDMPKVAKQTIVMDDTVDIALDADQATGGISQQIEDIRVSSNLTNSGFTRSQIRSPARLVALPSSALSYHQHVEPIDLTYEVGGDDFEQVERDEDALFSFDEDVNLEDLVDVGDEKVSLLTPVSLECSY